MINLDELRRKYLNSEISKSDYINLMFDCNSILFEYVKRLQYSDLKKIEIEENVKFVSRLCSLDFIFDRPDKRAAPFEIINFLTYEPRDSKIIYLLNENGKDFIDIGANVGWYSLHVANLYPKSKVFSFEPVPYTFSLLKRNVEGNKLPNLTIENLAISDSEGDLVIYQNNFSTVSSSAVNILEDNRAIPVNVSKTTLDKYFSTNYKGEIGLIKCDIEGAELFAMRGGLNVIKKHKPLIFLEMLRKWSAKYNYHPNEIINLLKEVGYLCTCLDSHNRLVPFSIVDDDTLETNFLFYHKDISIDDLNKKLGGSSVG